MSEWSQVGAVETLVLRIYPLDPMTPDDARSICTEVAVEPGIFPVYRNADAFMWIMTGRLNERSEKIGDGLFVLNDGDVPTGLSVEFPSLTYGKEQFAKFLADPICQPGPAQRLRFILRDDEINAVPNPLKETSK